MGRSVPGPKGSRKEGLGHPCPGVPMPQGHAGPCREAHQAADVMLLTTVFTPEWQSPLLCWDRPRSTLKAQAGTDHALRCCTSSVQRPCALSPGYRLFQLRAQQHPSPPTASCHRVTSPSPGSHEHSLGVSQLHDAGQTCPSECPLLLPGVSGRIPLPETSILWLLLCPQGLLFSTNLASYLGQTGYLYKQQISQEA